MGRPDELIDVEVVYALPPEQVVLHAAVPRSATLADAVTVSGLLTRFPEIDLACCAVGVFGERLPPDSTVTAGARIEIYRPLIADPKETRRRRAAKRKALKEG